MTPEELKQISDLLDAKITAQAAETQKAIDAATKPLAQKVAAAEKAEAAAKEAAAAAAKEQAEKAAAEEATKVAAASGAKGVDPQVAKLTEKLAALEADNKRRIDEAKALAEKAKADKLANDVREGLAAAGVPADRLGPALAVLLSEGRAKYSDKDEPGLEFKRKDYTDHLAPKEGAAEWLKTDAGKLFLPATNAQGSGDRAANGGRGGSGSGSEPATAEGLSRSFFGLGLASAAGS